MRAPTSKASAKLSWQDVPMWEMPVTSPNQPLLLQMSYLSVGARPIFAMVRVVEDGVFMFFT